MLDEERSTVSVKQIPLDGLSIEDLEARLDRLRSEIAECEALIEKKRSVRAAADALFRASLS